SGVSLPAIDANSARHAAAQQLSERTTAWATGLDLPLAATMTAALLEAAGHRPVAHRVIRSGWNRGIEREPGVPPSSRQRFLRAHARVRFRRGRYDDPELGETLQLLFEIEDPLAGALNVFRNTMRSMPFTNVAQTVDLLSNIELGDGGTPTDRVDNGLTL